MHHINFKLIFPTDNHINRYPLPQGLPVSVILKNQTFTSKILATLEIVRKLQTCHCYSDCKCEPTSELPLPLQICKEILQEFNYQTQLYFETVIQQDITYTYPNEYWLHYVTWKTI